MTRITRRAVLAALVAASPLLASAQQQPKGGTPMTPEKPSKVITPEPAAPGTEKADDKVAPMGPGSKNDFQFNQAVNLLKGLQILQKK